MHQKSDSKLNTSDAAEVFGIATVASPRAQGGPSASDGWSDRSLYWRILEANRNAPHASSHRASHPAADFKPSCQSGV